MADNDSFMPANYSGTRNSGHVPHPQFLYIFIWLFLFFWGTHLIDFGREWERRKRAVKEEREQRNRSGGKGGGALLPGIPTVKEFRRRREAAACGTVGRRSIIALFFATPFCVKFKTRQMTLLDCYTSYPFSRLTCFVLNPDRQKARKILTEKIAQLNSAIDDVSAQLCPEDTPNGAAVNWDELETAIGKCWVD